ncbi:MAG: tyrosine-type recombinase/integrase [Gammaproteobacteria bacterium]|nr:tyrosine-type recombinase/integrase [Gammaproteobacteria bacterium]
MQKLKGTYEEAKDRHHAWLSSADPNLFVEEVALPGWLSVETTPGFHSHVYLDTEGRPSPLVTSFFTSLRRSEGLSLAPSTVVQYRHDFKRVLDFVEATSPIKDLSIDQHLKLIQRRHIPRVLQAMRHAGISSKTIRRRESILKKLLSWLTSEEAGCVRESHPYELDARLITKSSRRQTKLASELVSQSMVIELLNAFHNECERSLFHFIYDAGARISEALDVRLVDFPHIHDRHNENYLPMIIKGRKGQAGIIKERYVGISRPVVARVARYHASEQYRLAALQHGYALNDPEKPAFLTANGTAWKYSNAKSQFNCAVRRTALPDWLSPHDLRHGCVLAILTSEDMGTNHLDRLLEAKRRLGHNWLSTTEEIYGNLPATVLVALEKLAKGASFYKKQDEIVLATYLGPRLHKEKRGHRAVIGG